MFEEIFFPKTAEKYRAAPLVEQRERYLVHLEGLGSTRSTLRKCASDQLSLVRLLNLQEEDRVSSHRLEAAATNWSRPKGRRCSRSASPEARARFVGRGIEWLRFLEWLDEPEHKPHPHQAEIVIFESWLCQERGLSRATIRDYCHAANRFFFWLAGKGVPLSAVRMTDIDDVIAAEHNRGAWCRRTIHDYAQRLRAFFRFAEAHGWCAPGLAAGIMAPRFLMDETVPKGLRREDVLRLLASVQGNRPIDKRDRAILMLFVAYGLRAGEVGGLRLDDLDWEGEILRVRCPKPGRVHSWPLSHEVGHAILRYVREARPSGFGRVSSSRHVRPSDRSTESLCARSCTIASQASASSSAGEGRMLCGMPPPSTFWTRACR